MSISREVVEGLAPDEPLLKAARKLSASRKLSGLGCAGGVAWGEVLGSEAEPYRVAFDGAFDGASAAFRCSCPSRKLPCKHALALALRFAEKPEEFASGEKPAWVRDWEKARARQAAKAGAEARPLDAEARAKRAAAREAKVAGGLAELELWLRDVMRGGIASLPAQPYGFWDKIAARMTDAQCSGLARRLREMASVPHASSSNGGGSNGWHEEMLHRLGLLHLVIEGHKRLGSLPPARQADIKSLIGWNVDQNELLQSGEALRDSWLSLAYTEEEGEDGLRSGKTWLWGRGSNRAALIIQFGFGGAPIGSAAPVGTGFEGDLVFFPGSLGLRALVKQKFGPPQPAEFAPAGMGAPQVLEAWARGLALFPWLESLPCVLRDVVPARVGGALWALSERGSLELSTRRIDEWALLAASGGRALSLFGLWNGRAFEPLATLQTACERVSVVALPRLS